MLDIEYGHQYLLSPVKDYLSSWVIEDNKELMEGDVFIHVFNHGSKMAPPNFGNASIYVHAKSQSVPPDARKCSRYYVQVSSRVARKRVMPELCSGYMEII